MRKSLMAWKVTPREKSRIVDPAPLSVATTAA
jgi:hypothetical protein